MTMDAETALALKAMERTAGIARRRAAEKRVKIPVWRDGAVIYVDPNEESQEDGAAHSDSADSPSE